MTTPFPTLIGERVAAALDALEIDLPEGFDSRVTATADARFGDYQTNAAMLLGKAQRCNPRELAAKLVDALEIDDLCEPPEIAGPGFINFRIKADVLNDRLVSLLADVERCGVPETANPHRIVIDFSAPNIAKPMHVGHIRSTFIGESLARIARFLGHDVTTDNHIGDWGTQFGMIVHGWKNLLDESALENDPVHELVRVYREVNALAKEDETVLEACRAELARLQQGDPENTAIWKRCVDLSLGQLENLYARLDVKFDHYLGESYYNGRLAPLVDDLLAKGIAEISQGAACVFFPGVPGLGDQPCLVRKRDGAFLYATTDLATIDHRVVEWKADEIWYVVGAPQQLHFKQVFAVSARRGVECRMVHVPFGSILGENRKIMKTRDGQNVQLIDVLEEAVGRARKTVEEKNPSLPAEEKAAVAETVGLGAVKYAELSQHRMTDYIFSWDRMLSLQGNTAPYLQNACVRIKSIFRKLGKDNATPDGPLALTEPAEADLAQKLARFAETVPEVLADFRPNLLANYLYELADTFHGFYEHCPVVRSEGATRATRVALCIVTLRTLEKGLNLLGIGVPERM